MIEVTVTLLRARHNILVSNAALVSALPIAGAGSPAGGDLADPKPERQVARLLGAFVGAGLFFLVLPGTLVGVWNLLDITAARHSDGASQSWVQAHGHALLFGWVGSFIIGISLYALPKFRGAFLRSVPTGWAIFVLWTTVTTLRWVSSLWGWNTGILVPAAAATQFIAVSMLLWQVSASRRRGSGWETWNLLIFAGLLGMWVVTAYQVPVVLRMAEEGRSIISKEANHWLLRATLWLFLVPLVTGFSVRFIPTFLGLGSPRRQPLLLALAMLYLLPITWVAGRPGWDSILTLGAVLLVGYGLRILEPAVRSPKVRGVHPRFPFFVRLAFVWLLAAVILQVAGDSSGMLGASRHAFTVGFLATLILSMGPRILPSFLNSRELWSARLMFWSLAALTLGCFLRVTAEPLAYAGIAPWAWASLPVSAFIELSAVLLFAHNMLRSMATPIPAWFGREQIRETMPLYWYLASYPACRPTLIRAGLTSLSDGKLPNQYLTLRQAAERHGVNCAAVVASLGEFFESRLARSLRRSAGTRSSCQS